MANINTHLSNIKSALFGKDVRGSIHDGIDAINKEVESTTGRQEHLEDTFDQLVINSGNSNAEIVDARVGENGKSYAKLGDRLDSVDSQLEQNENKLNNLHIDVSLPPYNIKGNDIELDTANFKQAIIEAGEFATLYVPFDFEVNDTIYFLKGQKIKGRDTLTKISAKINKPILVSPSGQGGVDKILVDGNNVEGSIGFLINDSNNPYRGRFGELHIQNCEVGFKVYLEANGAGYNRFDYIGCHSCKNGIILETTNTGWFNACKIGYAFLHACEETGIRINDNGVGIDGISFNYLEAENCTNGVHVEKGYNIKIIDGWLEDNSNMNIILNPYPDTDHFYFGGFQDSGLEKVDYTFSRLSTYHINYRKNGTRTALRGVVNFDHIEALPDNEYSCSIYNPILYGYGQSYRSVTSGTDIDVTSINVVFLEYDTPTTIENLSRSGEFINHRSARYQQVILISKNSNITISKSNTNFILNENDWVSKQGATLTLVYCPFNSKWIEVSRTRS